MSLSLLQAVSQSSALAQSASVNQKQSNSSIAVDHDQFSRNLEAARNRIDQKRSAASERNAQQDNASHSETVRGERRVRNASQDHAAREADASSRNDNNARSNENKKLSQSSASENTSAKASAENTSDVQEDESVDSSSTVVALQQVIVQQETDPVVLSDALALIGINITPEQIQDYINGQPIPDDVGQALEAIDIGKFADALSGLPAKPSTETLAQAISSLVATTVDTPSEEIETGNLTGDAESKASLTIASGLVGGEGDDEVKGAQTFDFITRAEQVKQQPKIIERDLASLQDLAANTQDVPVADGVKVEIESALQKVVPLNAQAAVAVKASVEKAVNSAEQNIATIATPEVVDQQTSAGVQSVDAANLDTVEIPLGGIAQKVASADTGATVASDGTDAAPTVSQGGQGLGKNAELELPAGQQHKQEALDTAPVVVARGEGVETVRTSDGNLITRAVPLQSGQGNAADQVKVSIQHAVQQGVDKIQVHLNPPALGRVDVKLTMSPEGHVSHISIVASSQEALDALRQDARDLARALQDAGIKAEAGNMQFDLRGQSKEGQQFGWNNSGGKAGYGDDDVSGDDMLKAVPLSNGGYLLSSDKVLDIQV